MRFVDEIFVMNPLALWRYPEAVRFVPDAFVNVSVPIVELGVLSSVVDATPPASTENKVRDASWILM